jgi:hypothetical protein
MAVNAFFNPTIDDPIVSSLELMHMPEVHNELIGRFPHQRDLDFLKEMGRMVPVAQTNYSCHEENRLMDSIIISAKSNPSGYVVRITLDTTNHTESGTRSYPRVYDRVEFLNGAQGLIIAKNVDSANAHTIDIQPVNITDHDVVSAAVVGDVLGIFSDAHEEGGDGPTEILVPTTTVFSNRVQIFSDKMSVTSTEQGNQTYVNFTFPEGHPRAGESGRFLYIKGESDMIDRFMLKRELGILTNDINDANLLINSKVVRTTRGFIPHVKQYGELMDYINTPSMSTFDSMVRIQNKNYSEKDNMLLMGLNFGLGFKNFGVDLMKNGSVLYNSANGKAMESISLGFKTIEFSTGHRFHCKGLAALSHADTTGLPGMSYSDLAILCPTSKVRDTESKKMMDSFAVKYKKAAGKGARDWYKIWETGGNSDAGTDASLVRELHVASEEGAQIYGAKRFIYCSKKAS